MTTLHWQPISRNFEKEKQGLKVLLEETTTHPLLANKPKVNIVDKTKSGKSNAATAVVDPLADPLSGMKISDPLSDPLSTKFIDPLSADIKPAAYVETTSVLQNKPLLNKTITTPSTFATSNNTEKSAWDIKKQEIRKEYAFTGSVTMNSNAFTADSASSEDTINTRKVDKYEQRLATLEKNLANENGTSKEISMSLAEFEAQIATLHNNLKIAWSRDERVKALTIASQISKLLSELHNPLFYPSLFIYITDILQEFSQMVFTRLYNRAEEALAINNSNPMALLAPEKTSKKSTTTNKKLSMDFTSIDIPMSVKETGRNWLYKVSCIQELVVRIYMEISLLSVYRFLTDTDYPMIMNRLSSMIRGIGNPLIASYTRLYLVNISQIVAPQYTQHLLTLFQDMLFTFSILKTPEFITSLTTTYPNMTIGQYAYLLTPSLAWILHIVIQYFPQKEYFQSFLSLYRDITGNASFVLLQLMIYCDGNHYLPHAINGMLSLMKSTDILYATSTDLAIALGKQLLTIPLLEEQRLPVLNEVWKMVTKGQDLVVYSKCVHVWISVVMKYYSEREVIILISNLVTKLTAFWQQSQSNTTTITSTSNTADSNEIQEQILFQVEGILQTLFTPVPVSNSNEGGTAVEVGGYMLVMLTSEYFLKLLDLFRGNRKIVLCRNLMELFFQQASIASSITTSSSALQHINDPILINTLFELTRVLHDSLDGLSASSDVNSITSLLTQFILAIDFQKDVESQLTFYVECRNIFYNLSSIKELLIHLVNHLIGKTTHTLRLIQSNGNNTGNSNGTNSKRPTNKKMQNFIKGCLAYNYITIPSLPLVKTKLMLLLQCSEIALINQCLPQTDSFLKALILLLPELTGSNGLNKDKHDDSSATGVSTNVGVKYEVLDEFLLSFVGQLCAFLVLVPGHPEHGPFYLIQGLINAMKSLVTTATTTTAANATTTPPMLSSFAYHKIMLQIVQLLSILDQETLPYHFPNIQSNDELYGYSIEYRLECAQLKEQLLIEYWMLMKALHEATTPVHLLTPLFSSSSAVATTAFTAIPAPLQAIHISITNMLSNDQKKQLQCKLYVEFINVSMMTMYYTPDFIALILTLLEIVTTHKQLLNSQEMRYYQQTVRFVYNRVKATAAVTTSSDLETNSKKGLGFLGKNAEEIVQKVQKFVI